MKKPHKFLIITSRFNEDITTALQQGARDTLLREGVEAEYISEISVPGAFELSSVAAKAASLGKWDAIICLGCLIKGDTDHYHYISEAVANGLTEVGVQYKLPVLFGVLTVDNKQQALERVRLDKQNMDVRQDGKIIVHNKGQSCALAALLTLKSMGELDGSAN